MEDDTDPDMVSRRIAVNVKTARENAGLSQEALAQGMREMGHRFHQQTIGKIEAGDRHVSISEGLALARVLGTNIEMLTRPAEHTADAFRILIAARRVREARSAAETANRKHRDMVQLLERALERARKDGLEKALADEIGAGERTLAGSRTGGTSD